MYTPTRGNTLNLTQKELDNIWAKTEKVGSVTLDPETKWFWDNEMRARALDIDQLSEEGMASLEGPTDFGMTEEVK